jgi:hypothetical protein
MSIGTGLGIGWSITTRGPLYYDIHGSANTPVMPVDEVNWLCTEWMAGTSRKSQTVGVCLKFGSQRFCVIFSTTNVAPLDTGVLRL